MTKVTILGKEPKEKKKLKPIEFVKYFRQSTMKFEPNNHVNRCLPLEWDNIELICIDFEETGLDLMFAYDLNRNDDNFRCLYLGHFNDGIVE